MPGMVKCTVGEGKEVGLKMILMAQVLFCQCY